MQLSCFGVEAARAALHHAVEKLRTGEADRRFVRTGRDTLWLGRGAVTVRIAQIAGRSLELGDPYSFQLDHPDRGHSIRRRRFGIMKITASARLSGA